MGSVWMLGAVNECQSENHLFALSLGPGESWQIRKVETDTSNTPQTVGSAMTRTPDGQLIVFGGLIYCRDLDFVETYDETWTLDLSSLFSTSSSSTSSSRSSDTTSTT
eukprot:3684397-Amphidinium_carterae.1